eukprot:maker-scaffold38_size502422-snap-gene-4.29 protein:Tk05885 transcript:maker-scaffold38_size502422-snap-gene-4.29-mRNA-1 annotation:"cdp-diacylglycerol--inositol 3-phosphatidyltransferase"
MERIDGQAKTIFWESVNSEKQRENRKRKHQTTVRQDRGEKNMGTRKGRKHSPCLGVKSSGEDLEDFHVVVDGVTVAWGIMSTEPAKMETKENIFVFVPNLIGYGRIILAIISFWFMPTNYVISSWCYILSGLLDAFDGHAARLLNQSTKFGAMLDMLTDRCATMALLATLCTFYPTWTFFFQLSMIIDVSCHWIHLHASLLQVGSTTHLVSFVTLNSFLSPRCYILSGLLDAFDGHAARLRQQSTKFGAMLDMLTDRCATMALLATLCTFYPTWTIFFQLSMIIDVSCHWIHLHASLLQGATSHKFVSADGNPIMHIYYNSRPVLFGMCAGNELFYCMLPSIFFISPTVQFFFLFSPQA